LDAPPDDADSVVRNPWRVTEAHALELFREAVYDLVEQRTPENVRRCLVASQILDRAREGIEPASSAKAPRESVRR
jgi:hypothetical protein